MSRIRASFAMGLETECLTVEAEPAHGRRGGASERLLELLDEIAPSLRGPTGIFQGYGRIYLDLGHVEVATCECDSPFRLVSVYERQQSLVREAVRRLADEGGAILLANTNHNGVIEPRSTVTWGSHENYAVPVDPAQFADRLVPFAATRLYAGSGALRFPDGAYLASARAPFLQTLTTGNTTETRGLVSTARMEPHAAAGSGWYRLHLISGDGHVSHFNLALQFGATYLAAYAAIHDPELPGELERVAAPIGSIGWLELLDRINVLARPGEDPRVDPRALKVQRLYLEAARRTSARLPDRPAWADRVLEDWDSALGAMERGDRAWLASRLDAFAKYEILAGALRRGDRTFADLRGDRPAFARLALLEQRYHDFGGDRALVDRLERAGVLDHRVGPRIEPGGEREPFVPETGTRAEPRARFVREHGGSERYLVDWARVLDLERHRIARFEHPFVRELGKWSRAQPELEIPIPPSFRRGRTLMELRRSYRSGDYDRARRAVHLLETMGGRTLDRRLVVRYRAWIDARFGIAGAHVPLERLHGTFPEELEPIDDLLYVHRHAGFVPSERHAELVDHGLRRVDEVGDRDPSAAAAVREHAAFHLSTTGRSEEALRIVSRALESLGEMLPHGQARLLVAHAECLLASGDRPEAIRAYRRAWAFHRRHGLYPEIADRVYLGFARCETDREGSLRWLLRMRRTQHRHRLRFGHARTLVLQAILAGGTSFGAAARRRARRSIERIPALRACPAARRLLELADASGARRAEGAGEETLDGVLRGVLALRGRLAAV